MKERRITVTIFEPLSADKCNDLMDGIADFVFEWFHGTLHGYENDPVVSMSPWEEVGDDTDLAAVRMDPGNKHGSW